MRLGLDRAAVYGGALFGEGACLFVACQFGDLAVAGNPLRLVATLFAAGALFLLAMAAWPETWRRSAMVFWSATIAFRLVLLPMEPADDFWRYAWEGRVQDAGKNPYLLAPNAPELAGLRDVDWAKINHPESRAIYPPAAELAFRGLAWTAAARENLPAFKGCFVLADLATCALLLLVLKGPDRHRRAAWYALNPAVIYAFAGAAHYDSLMLCALMGAVVLASVHDRLNGELNRWLAAFGAAALLGVSIAFKLVPVLLVPLFACAFGRRWTAIAVAAGIPVALAIPFGGTLILGPLRAFAEVTRFHDLAWWAVEAVTFPNPYGRNWPFTLLLVLAISGLSWRFRTDWQRGILWVIGAALLLSPVLHPWYVTWILPIAAWRQAPAWAVLGVSSLGALVLWESTILWQAWQPNLVTRLLVILPPLLTLLPRLQRQSA